MKRLKIQNLILIQNADIAFGPHLNILTGETGSGKSAILSAIRLIAGERADSGCIRQGANMAVVEAEFENGSILRREIHRSGKNRCFIDDALVSLAALKEAVQIEMVDQSSSILGQEQALLDQFAGIVANVADFERSQSDERQLTAELHALLTTPKERELEWAQKDLALIDEVRWKEETKLNEEHHFLTHSQELAEKMGAVATTLAEGLPQMKRALAHFEACVRVDSALAPTAHAMKGALLELDEVERAVQSYTDKLEVQPGRLEAVEREIGAIVSLKRRFEGDIEGQKQRLTERIEHLLQLDAQIAAFKQQLDVLCAKNTEWAQAIDAKRREASPRFAALVLEELRSLNLPHAQFVVVVDAPIQFLFSANPGHPPVPMAECASGGELSRLLLAIKTILSEGKATLVFDEIDSNVGGQTASAIGEKLRRIATARQVICVTHFVQVAKWGHDHFLVAKMALGGDTHTTIQKMGEKERELEYNRMLGHV